MTSRSICFKMVIMQTVNNVIQDVIDDAELFDRGMSIFVNEDGSCLDRDDFRAWNNDTFNIVCSNISERHRKINKRLAKYTSADILACIKFESASPDAKLDRQSSKWGRRMQFSTGASISLENLIQCGSDHQFQDSESNCNRSAVECKAFPKDDIISVSPQKPLSNYVNQPQSPTRRRPWQDNIPNYDHPFDPRLSFNGLANLIQRASPDSAPSDAVQAPVPDTFNCLIESECPTEFTNAYLAAHRRYLRGLTAEAERRATGTPVLPTVPDINNPRAADASAIPGFVGDGVDDIDLWDTVQCSRCLWEKDDSEFKVIQHTAPVAKPWQILTATPEPDVQWVQPPASTASPAEHGVTLVQQHGSTNVPSVQVRATTTSPERDVSATHPPSTHQKSPSLRKPPARSEKKPHNNVERSPQAGSRNLIARVQTRPSPKLADGEVSSVSCRKKSSGARPVETKPHKHTAHHNRNQQIDAHGTEYSAYSTRIEHEDPDGNFWSEGSTERPLSQQETMCSQGVHQYVPTFTTATTTTPPSTETTQFPHRSSVFWAHQPASDGSNPQKAGQWQGKTAAGQINQAQVPCQGVSPRPGGCPLQQHQQHVCQDGQVPQSHHHHHVAPVFHQLPSCPQSEAAVLSPSQYVTPPHSQCQGQYRQFVTPIVPTTPFNLHCQAGKAHVTAHQQPQPQPHAQYHAVPQTSNTGAGSSRQTDNSQARQVAVDDEVWYINGVPHYNARPVQQTEATANTHYNIPPTLPQVPRPCGANGTAFEVRMVRPPFVIQPSSLNLPPPPPNAIFQPYSSWQPNNVYPRSNSSAKQPTSKIYGAQTNRSKLNTNNNNNTNNNSNTNNNNQSDFEYSPSGDNWSGVYPPYSTHTDDVSVSVSHFSAERVSPVGHFNAERVSPVGHFDAERVSPKGDKITVLGAQMSRREDDHGAKKKKLRSSRADLVRIV